ncbi:MAG: hypothetical protein HYS41_03070 [Candidatus Omnitrophica bacterium]|nr:hypothetical protein [Candidatus Omnitrophota bacterium]
MRTNTLAGLVRRFFALWLILALACPAPAYSLRESQEDTTLDELPRALTGLEETPLPLPAASGNGDEILREIAEARRLAEGNTLDQNVTTIASVAVDGSEKSIRMSWQDGTWEDLFDSFSVAVKTYPLLRPLVPGPETVTEQVRQKIEEAKGLEIPVFKGDVGEFFLSVGSAARLKEELLVLGRKPPSRQELDELASSLREVLEEPRSGRTARQRLDALRAQAGEKERRSLEKAIQAMDEMVREFLADNETIWKAIAVLEKAVGGDLRRVPGGVAGDLLRPLTQRAGDWFLSGLLLRALLQDSPGEKTLEIEKIKKRLALMEEEKRSVLRYRLSRRADARALRAVFYDAYRLALSAALEALTEELSQADPADEGRAVDLEIRIWLMGFEALHLVKEEAATQAVWSSAREARPSAGPVNNIRRMTPSVGVLFLRPDGTLRRFVPGGGSFHAPHMVGYFTPTRFAQWYEPGDRIYLLANTLTGALALDQFRSYLESVNHLQAVFPDLPTPGLGIATEGGITLYHPRASAGDPSGWERICEPVASALSCYIEFFDQMHKAILNDDDKWRRKLARGQFGNRWQSVVRDAYPEKKYPGLLAQVAKDVTIQFGKRISNLRDVKSGELVYEIGFLEGQVNRIVGERITQGLLGGFFTEEKVSGLTDRPFPAPTPPGAPASPAVPPAETVQESPFAASADEREVFPAGLLQEAPPLTDPDPVRRLLDEMTGLAFAGGYLPDMVSTEYEDLERRQIRLVMDAGASRALPFLLVSLEFPETKLSPLAPEPRVGGRPVERLIVKRIRKEEASRIVEGMPGAAVFKEVIPKVQRLLDADAPPKEMEGPVKELLPALVKFLEQGGGGRGPMEQAAQRLETDPAFREVMEFLKRRLDVMMEGDLLNEELWRKRGKLEAGWARERIAAFRSRLSDPRIQACLDCDLEKLPLQGKVSYDLVAAPVADAEGAARQGELLALMERTDLKALRQSYVEALRLACWKKAMELQRDLETRALDYRFQRESLVTAMLALTLETGAVLSSLMQSQAGEIRANESVKRTRLATGIGVLLLNQDNSPARFVPGGGGMDLVHLMGTHYNRHSIRPWHEKGQKIVLCQLSFTGPPGMDQLAAFLDDWFYLQRGLDGNPEILLGVAAADGAMRVYRPSGPRLPAEDPVGWARVRDRVETVYGDHYNRFIDAFKKLEGSPEKGPDAALYREAGLHFRSRLLEALQESLPNPMPEQIMAKIEDRFGPDLDELAQDPRPMRVSSLLAKVKAAVSECLAAHLMESDLFVPVQVPGVTGRHKAAAGGALPAVVREILEMREKAEGGFLGPNVTAASASKLSWTEVRLWMNWTGSPEYPGGPVVLPFGSPAMRPLAPDLELLEPEVREAISRGKRWQVSRLGRDAGLKEMRGNPAISALEKLLLPFEKGELVQETEEDSKAAVKAVKERGEYAAWEKRLARDRSAPEKTKFKQWLREESYKELERILREKERKIRQKPPPKPRELLAASRAVLEYVPNKGRPDFRERPDLAPAISEAKILFEKILRLAQRIMQARVLLERAAPSGKVPAAPAISCLEPLMGDTEGWPTVSIKMRRQLENLKALSPESRVNLEEILQIVEEAREEAITWHTFLTFSRVPWAPLRLVYYDVYRSVLLDEVKRLELLAPETNGQELEWQSRAVALEIMHAELEAAFSSLLQRWARPPEEKESDQFTHPVEGSGLLVLDQALRPVRFIPGGGQFVGVTILAPYYDPIRVKEWTGEAGQAVYLYNTVSGWPAVESLDYYCAAARLFSAMYPGAALPWFGVAAPSGVRVYRPREDLASPSGLGRAYDPIAREEARFKRFTIGLDIRFLRISKEDIRFLFLARGQFLGELEKVLRDVFDEATVQEMMREVRDRLGQSIEALDPDEKNLDALGLAFARLVVSVRRLIGELAAPHLLDELFEEVQVDWEHPVQPLAIPPPAQAPPEQAVEREPETTAPAPLLLKLDDQAAEAGPPPQPMPGEAGGKPAKGSKGPQGEDVKLKAAAREIASNLAGLADAAGFRGRWVERLLAEKVRERLKGNNSWQPTNGIEPFRQVLVQGREKHHRQGVELAGAIGKCKTSEELERLKGQVDGLGDDEVDKLYEDKKRNIVHQGLAEQAVGDPVFQAWWPPNRIQAEALGLLKKNPGWTYEDLKSKLQKIRKSWEEEARQREEARMLAASERILEAAGKEPSLQGLAQERLGALAAAFLKEKPKGTPADFVAQLREMMSQEGQKKRGELKRLCLGKTQEAGVSLDWIFPSNLLELEADVYLDKDSSPSPEGFIAHLKELAKQRRWKELREIGIQANASEQFGLSFVQIEEEARGHVSAAPFTDWDQDQGAFVERLRERAAQLGEELRRDLIRRVSQAVRSALNPDYWGFEEGWLEAQAESWLTAVPLSFDPDQPEAFLRQVKLERLIREAQTAQELTEFSIPPDVVRQEAERLLAEQGIEEIKRTPIWFVDRLYKIYDAKKREEEAKKKGWAGRVGKATSSKELAELLSQPDFPEELRPVAENRQQLFLLVETARESALLRQAGFSDDELIQEAAQLLSGGEPVTPAGFVKRLHKIWREREALKRAERIEQLLAAAKADPPEGGWIFNGAELLERATGFLEFSGAREPVPADFVAQLKQEQARKKLEAEEKRVRTLVEAAQAASDRSQWPFSDAELEAMVRVFPGNDPAAFLAHLRRKIEEERVRKEEQKRREEQARLQGFLEGFNHINTERGWGVSPERALAAAQSLLRESPSATVDQMVELLEPASPEQVRQALSAWNQAADERVDFGNQEGAFTISATELLDPNLWYLTSHASVGVERIERTLEAARSNPDPEKGVKRLASVETFLEEFGQAINDLPLERGRKLDGLTPYSVFRERFMTGSDTPATRMEAVRQYLDVLKNRIRTIKQTALLRRLKEYLTGRWSIEEDREEPTASLISPDALIPLLVEDVNKGWTSLRAAKLLEAGKTFIGAHPWYPSGLLAMNVQTLSTTDGVSPDEVLALLDAALARQKENPKSLGEVVAMEDHLTEMIAQRLEESAAVGESDAGLEEARPTPAVRIPEGDEVVDLGTLEGGETLGLWIFPGNGERSLIGRILIDGEVKGAVFLRFPNETAVLGDILVGEEKGMPDPLHRGRGVGTKVMDWILRNRIPPRVRHLTAVVRNPYLLALFKNLEERKLLMEATVSGRGLDVWIADFLREHELNRLQDEYGTIDVDFRAGLNSNHVVAGPSTGPGAGLEEARRVEALFALERAAGEAGVPAGDSSEKAEEVRAHGGML